jgi:hypothetical protein
MMVKKRENVEEKDEEEGALKVFDVLIHVFERLEDQADIGRCAQVCLAWREAADSHHLWRTITLRLRYTHLINFLVVVVVIFFFFRSALLLCCRFVSSAHSRVAANWAWTCRAAPRKKKKKMVQMKKVTTHRRSTSSCTRRTYTSS